MAQPEQPWPLRVLARVCPPQLYESIEGDLLERLENDESRYGLRRAKVLLAWNAMCFLRPGILFRNKISVQLNYRDMLLNYLKVMLRAMAKRKTYSAINIFGLTAGITFALVIGIFIHQELQVNQNLRDVDRLYIVQSKYQKESPNFEWFAPAPMVKQLLDDYPTVFENYYRFWDRQVTVSMNDKHLRIQGMIGDSTFLDMFGFTTLYGNPLAALLHPGSVVITERVARQFFGTANVVGKSLAITTELSGVKDFTVTAVIADTEQKNSVSDFMNMDAEVFLPLEARGDFTLNDPLLWPSEIITYLKLKKGATRADGDNALNKTLQQHGPESIRDKRTLTLNPLQDYYLVTNHGAVQNLIVSLGIIVLFIVLLAVANFINITIASSFARLKEIGVRKVIGGVRRQVIVQFISESVMLSLIAGILALGIYELSRSYFGQLLETALPSVLAFNLRYWTAVAGGIAIIGLLAGLYPAIYLSTTRAIESLKGKARSVKGTIRFSRGLIAMQFLIAIFIFTVSVIMGRQVSYFLEKDLGYDNSSLLIVSSVPRMWNAEGFDRMDQAKTEFQRAAAVENVSLSWGSPSWNFSPLSDRLYVKGGSAEEGQTVAISSADEDYADVYSLTLLEGKFMANAGEARMPLSIVLNESAQKALNAHLGDVLRLQRGGEQDFVVTGVVKDFHFESLHESVKPVLFMHNRDFAAYRYFSFKLKPDNLLLAVEEVEKLWKQQFPDDPFVYTFSDEKLAALYKTELQLKKASRMATVLMVIIVLTGVVGLVSLSVSKRTKEIGIRKVLGASSSNLLVLLSREYAWIMSVSFLAGIPLSYYFIHQWLGGFAYHIDLAAWMFVLPIAMLFVLTLLIVALQALRAVFSNPVKALRYE